MDPDDRANMAKQHLAYIAMPLMRSKSCWASSKRHHGIQLRLNGLRQMLLNRLKETVHRFLASRTLACVVYTPSSLTVIMGLDLAFALVCRRLSQSSLLLSDIPASQDEVNFHLGQNVLHMGAHSLEGAFWANLLAASITV